MSAAETLLSASDVQDMRIDRAVVFLSRPSLRSIIMREFKSAGVEKVKAVEDSLSCIEWLIHNPQGLLVIDWDHSEEIIKKVLRAAQGDYGVDTRPIYLLGFENSPKMLAVAHENNVMQLHTGEISKAAIERNLKELINFSILTPECRDTFIKVVRARKSNNGKQALELMRNLYRAEPNNLRAAVEYGYCLCEDGSLQDAIDHLTSVASRYPFELKSRHLLARAYMKLGKYADAEKHLSDAELIDPKNVERLCELGRALLNQDKLTRALGKFNEALALDSDCHDAKIGRAQCQLLTGQMNEGLKLMGQMRNAQELASVFNGAAIIAIRRKNFKQGLTLYKTAVSYLEGESIILARVFFNMGLCFTKWGKAPLAIEAFQKSARLDPTFAKAMHNAKLLLSLKKRGISLQALKSEMGAPLSGGPVIADDAGDLSVEEDFIQSPFRPD